ncbi:MAG: SUMF1/EgtB/PvdO family nonheme iron enzyme [Myxococcota bacterium]|nr:SUMF1/EgtB/PvdO family nonheme iron enzyme [Myxococcota bacterium]
MMALLLPNVPRVYRALRWGRPGLLLAILCTLPLSPPLLAGCFVQRTGDEGGEEGSACVLDVDCRAEAGLICRDRVCAPPECESDDSCRSSRGPDYVCTRWRCTRIAPDAGLTDAGTEPDGGTVVRCDPPCRDGQVCVQGRCTDPCLAPLPCPDDLVVPLEGFIMDAHEASRPDATATSAGCNGGRACSVAGRLPWTGLSWSQAEAACLAAGKRLCTLAEWRLACGGFESRRYPYGDTFTAGVCNGGTGAAGAPWPTGSGAGCVTPEGVFDLAGNVHEWLSDALGERERATLGGSHLNNATQIACDYDYSRESSTYRSDLVGFRCCR